MYKKNKKKFNQKTSYLKGFIISFILTLVSFLLTLIAKSEFYFLEKNFIIKLIIFICAILQIFTHLVYFLHLNINNIDNIWLSTILIFTTIIISIILIGSIWIIYNLNSNM